MVRSRRPTRVLFALVLLVSASASLRAGDAWPVSRGPSHEPNPYRFDPAQIKHLPKKFLEDSAACVLYAGNTYLVEADGTVETITHEVTRLNGRKGIEKLGEYRNIFYDPVVPEAHPPRGPHPQERTAASSNVEPRHVQLRDVATDYQVYDHDKQLIISFPDARSRRRDRGQVERARQEPRARRASSSRATRSAIPTYPVVLDEFRVRLPKEQAVQVRHDRRQARTGHQRGRRFPHVHLESAATAVKLPQDDNLPSREELHLSACLLDVRFVGGKSACGKSVYGPNAGNALQQVREVVRRSDARP